VSAKRLFDLVVVIGLSPVWVPLLAITAIAVRVGMGRPVFYRQKRAGLGGATFELVKFRTMVDARDRDGRSLPDDQRLTAFGRALRASSLDELPELINVLRGDMSLVGPRPLLSQYLPLYSEHHRRRHDVPPGLTGLAQVSGRNALTWPERFDLDVWYVDNASLALDARIIAKTIGAVVTRRGVTAPGEASMSYFTGYEQPSSAPDYPAAGRSPEPDRSR
jgi:lipopolysaccharide/colanic/teichoic acid biosynthesis glycosyltransferase